MIAVTPAGGPDITNVQVSDPDAEISPVSYKDRGDEHRVRVTIRFSNGVDQRWLGISAAVDSHDGESRATLSVGLSDATGERLPTEDLVGAHSWTGTLCDGSVAQVNYTVNAGRSVSAPCQPALIVAVSGFAETSWRLGRLGRSRRTRRRHEWVNSTGRCGCSAEQPHRRHWP